MKTVKKILYLEPEKKSTDELIETIVERVKEVDVNSVIVASTKGKSALKLANALKGSVDIVSVTEFTYNDDVVKNMKKQGVKVIEKADLPIQDRRGMSEALLFFGEGVKAALEVAAIAAEREAVEGKVVAVAGSKGNLDTALLIRPAPPINFISPDPDKRMSVLEVIAMPLRE